MHGVVEGSDSRCAPRWHAPAFSEDAGILASEYQGVVLRPQSWDYDVMNPQVFHLDVYVSFEAIIRARVRLL